MIATLSRFFAFPMLPPLPDVKPAESKPYRPPLFIGDVATPRGRETEFYHQWTRRAPSDDSDD